MTPAPEPQTRRPNHKALANVCRLLSRFWIRELDEASLLELHETDLGRAYQSVGGFVPPLDPERLEQIEMDFCQLFVGPTDHLPPYQSVWEEGALDGEASVSMRQYVELLDYPNSERLIDSLGFQLDLMGWLLEDESHVDSLDLRLEIEQQYFNSHLRWAAVFLEAARQKTSTDFYRHLIDVTDTFLKMLEQELFE